MTFVFYLQLCINRSNDAILKFGRNTFEKTQGIHCTINIVGGGGGGGGSDPQWTTVNLCVPADLVSFSLPMEARRTYSFSLLNYFKGTGQSTQEGKTVPMSEMNEASRMRVRRLREFRWDQLSFL